MIRRVPMTVEGEAKLRAELDQLKKVERPRVVAAIAEARAHGDLKENAEYHAAKEQQGFIEGRIAEIESKLSESQVIDITRISPTGRVIFGVTLKVFDVDKDEERIFKIVGEDEADYKENKISVSSPIARGLIGKHVGDEVSVDTPGGGVTYEILEVNHI